MTYKALAFPLLIQAITAAISKYLALAIIRKLSTYFGQYKLNLLALWQFSGERVKLKTYQYLRGIYIWKWSWLTRLYRPYSGIDNDVFLTESQCSIGQRVNKVARQRTMLLKVNANISY